MATQTHKAYLRGLRGVVITELDATGAEPTGAESAIVDVATTASYESILVEGPKQELRGGDRVLAYYAERDHVVGHRITLTNARADLLALVLIQGGALIEEVVDATTGATRVVGWKPPRVGVQHLGPYFKLEAYQASFNSSGGVEGYVKHTWPFCFGTLQRWQIEDQQWTAPELQVYAIEPPDSTREFYTVEFVTAAAVPAGLAWGPGV